VVNAVGRGDVARGGGVVDDLESGRIGGGRGAR
jgi:hypothetical protein